MKHRTVLAALALAGLALGNVRAQAQFASGVYVDSVNGSAINYVPPGNGTPTTLISGLTNAAGFAFNATGTELYVAESTGGNTTTTIAEFTPAGGSTPVNSFTINAADPQGLAVDSNGRLFVAVSNDSGHTSVYEVANPTSATPTVTSYVSSGVAEATGIAIASTDPSGNDTLYVGGNSGLYEATSSSLSKITNLPGGSAYGVAFDGTNVYFTQNNSNVTRVDAGGNNPTTIATGNNPYGLALNPTSGALVFSGDGGNTYVTQVTSPGGSPSQSAYNTSGAIPATGNYLAYSPAFEPANTGTPEPGSLALGAVVALIGLAGWARNRRRVG